VEGGRAEKPSKADKGREGGPRTSERARRRQSGKRGHTRERREERGHKAISIIRGHRQTSRGIKRKRRRKKEKCVEEIYIQPL